jgi:hypothetical protein
MCEIDTYAAKYSDIYPKEYYTGVIIIPLHGCGMTVYGHIVMAMEGYYMITPSWGIIIL